MGVTHLSPSLPTFSLVHLSSLTHTLSLWLSPSPVMEVQPESVSFGATAEQLAARFEDAQPSTSRGRPALTCSLLPWLTASTHVLLSEQRRLHLTLRSYVVDKQANLQRLPVPVSIDKELESPIAHCTLDLKATTTAAEVGSFFSVERR